MNNQGKINIKSIFFILLTVILSIGLFTSMYLFRSQELYEMAKPEHIMDDILASIKNYNPYSTSLETLSENKAIINNSISDNSTASNSDNTAISLNNGISANSDITATNTSKNLSTKFNFKANKKRLHKHQPINYDFNADYSLCYDTINKYESIQDYYKYLSYKINNGQLSYICITKPEEISIDNASLTYGILSNDELLFTVSLNAVKHHNRIGIDFYEEGL